MSDRQERWEREKQVLSLAARGANPTQIAEEVKVTRATVVDDLKMIYKRYTDLLIIDGCAVGEMLTRIGTVIVRQNKIADKAVKVREVRENKDEKPQLVTEPDYNARTAADARVLEAIRLQAMILGFGKTEQSPVFAFINQTTNNAPPGGGKGEFAEVPADNIPAVRKHLRQLRTLLGREQVTTVTDARTQMALRGVKDAPQEGDLHGVLFEVPPGDDPQAIPATAEEVSEEPVGDPDPDDFGSAGGHLDVSFAATGLDRAADNDAGDDGADEEGCDFEVPSIEDLR